MTILTLDAIEAHPKNAVEMEIPADADRVLLQAAYCAARYWADINYILMRAACDGLYIPADYAEGMAAGELFPDVHEDNEAEWFRADRRVVLIAERMPP